MKRVLRKAFHTLPPSSQIWVRRNFLKRHDPSELGERIVVTDDLDNHHITDFIGLAHITRYKWVLPLVVGKFVLDDGCGTGYGTHYLAKHGVRIIGIDKSRKAIKYAQEHYRNDRLEFRQANALHTGFPDNHFDAVVSFDVLEHLTATHQETFLKEIHRILRTNGSLYIGTPNKNHDSNPNKRPYHKRELSAPQFRSILEAFFTNCSFLAQELIMDDGCHDNEGRRHLEHRKLLEENFTITCRRLEGFALIAMAHKN